MNQEIKLEKADAKKIAVNKRAILLYLHNNYVKMNGLLFSLLNQDIFAKDIQNYTIKSHFISRYITLQDIIEIQFP